MRGAGPSTSRVRACAERASSGIYALSAHPLFGIVALIEAPESVTPILVCLTYLAGALGFDHPLPRCVPVATAELPGVCSGRGLRAERCGLGRSEPRPTSRVMVKKNSIPNG